MEPETRLILIKLAEDFADGIRTGRIDFTEAQGRRVISAVGEALNPQPRMRICNITQACDYLGVSQPTFRKYVREGRIPAGQKMSGFSELLWDKNDIEAFKRQELSGRRKKCK